jgi:hypothetical protein
VACVARGTRAVCAARARVPGGRRSDSAIRRASPRFSGDRASASACHRSARGPAARRRSAIGRAAATGDAPTSTVAAVPPPLSTAPSRFPAPAAVERTVPSTTEPARPLPLREELLNASRHWLDAYYRQDKSAMAKLAIPDVSIEDDREDGDRIPPGLPDVKRTLTGVSFHQTPTVAMITANMVEQSGDTGSADSYVSHLWVRQDGSWRLQTFRITEAPPAPPAQ